MKVVINGISFHKKNAAYTKYFIQNVFEQLCLQQAKDAFIFVVNDECKGQFSFALNTREILIKKKKSSIAQAVFYAVQLPLLLQKIKPDIVLQPFGKIAATSFPQVVISENPFLQKVSVKTITKAKRVLTYTQNNQQEIQQQFPTAINKIKKLPFVLQAQIVALSFVQKQQQTAKLTNGKSFFLFYDDTSSADDALTVLKAFSLFKKRMQSNMQLIIVSVYDNDLDEKLKSYKYREDVVLLGEAMMNDEVLQSAYAFIQNNQQQQLSPIVAKALMAGIPVISCSNKNLEELFATQILMPETFTPEAISNFMNLLYRDETYRNTIAANGQQTAVSFQTKEAVNELWKTLTEVVVSS